MADASSEAGAVLDHHEGADDDDRTHHKQHIHHSHYCDNYEVISDLNAQGPAEHHHLHPGRLGQPHIHPPHRHLHLRHLGHAGAEPSNTFTLASSNISMWFWPLISPYFSASCSEKITLRKTSIQIRYPGKLFTSRWLLHIWYTTES